MRLGFEGSYMGDAARISPATRLECKVCWHVYDPAEGCEVWQVPPGTPFSALPDHWRCPVCDGARDQFMVLDGGDLVQADLAQEDPARDAPELEADDPDLVRRVKAAPALFEAAFREIHAGKMKGVPFVNETLGVKAVGFCIHEGRGLGVLVTPWFMNLVLLPGAGEDWSNLRTGERTMVDFPSGAYEFLAADRVETGPYKACSLFSPMFDFSSMLQAVETAQAVIPALLDPANRADGTRTAEIRRLREAELAAAESAAAKDAADAGPDEGALPIDAPSVPSEMSRRAIIFGPRAEAGESEA